MSMSSSSQRSPGGPSSKVSRSDDLDEDEVQSMQFKIILLGDGAVGKVLGWRTMDYFCGLCTPDIIWNYILAKQETFHQHHNIMEVIQIKEYFHDPVLRTSIFQLSADINREEVCR